MARFNLFGPAVTGGSGLTLGWLLNSVNSSGSPTMSQASGIGISLATFILSACATVYTAYRAGGGKLDGTLTKKEATDVGHALAEALGVPGAKDAVDLLAPVIAAEVNKLIGGGSFPMSIGPTQPALLTPPAGGIVLSSIWQDLDKLSSWASDNPDALKSAASLRQAIHDIYFPSTTPPAAPSAV